MGVCYNHDCMNTATFKCSGCKVTWYCGTACQNLMWPTHKQECKLQRMVYDMEKKQEEEDQFKQVEKPRSTHCTGCNVKFTSDYGRDQLCPDCGYATCESCSCSNNKGSCYCQNSNFGYPYCTRQPQWYHMSSRTGRGYSGDRHPSNSWDELTLKKHPEAYEKEPRACNNCGEVVRLVKREYL